MGEYLALRSQLVSWNFSGYPKDIVMQFMQCADRTIKQQNKDLTTLQAEHNALVDGVNGLVKRWGEISAEKDLFCEFQQSDMIKGCTNELQALTKDGQSSISSGS